MSLRANALANFAGQFLAPALALALAPAYIGRLGLEAWGLVGILNMFSAWSSLLDVGLTPAVTRALARARAGDADTRREAVGLVRCVEWIYVVLVIVIVAFAIAFSRVAVTHWLNVAETQVDVASAALGCIGAVVALRLWENVYRGALTGLEQLVTLNLLSGGLAVVRWAGGLAFIASLDAPTVVDLFAWQLGVSVLSLVTFAIVCRRRLRAMAQPARADFSALRRIRGFVGGIATSSILGLMLTQVDKLLLSKFLSLAEFGLYALAASLADALALLAAPLYGTLAPRFVRLHEAGDTRALGGLYMQASQFLAVVLAPCALLLIVNGDKVVQAWSGDAALAGRIASLVALLAFGRMLNASMQLPAALQFGAGWTALGVKMNLVAVLLLVPVVVVTVPRYGAIAYAWSWVALNVCYLAAGTLLMHRRLLPEVRDRWLRDAIVVPVLVASASMLVARRLIDAPEGRLSLAMVLVFVLAASVAVNAWIAPATRVLWRARWRS